jgi:hypothetical protein
VERKGDRHDRLKPLARTQFIVSGLLSEGHFGHRLLKKKTEYIPLESKTSGFYFL